MGSGVIEKKERKEKEEEKRKERRKKIDIIKELNEL